MAGAGVAYLFPLSFLGLVGILVGGTDKASARASLGSGVAIGLAPLLLGIAADAMGLTTALLLIPLLILAAAVNVGRDLPAGILIPQAIAVGPHSRDLERLVLDPGEEVGVAEELVLGDPPGVVVGMDVLDVTGGRGMKRQVGDAGLELGQEPLEGPSADPAPSDRSGPSGRCLRPQLPGPSAGLGQFGDIHLSHLVGRTRRRRRPPAAQKPLDVGGKGHRQDVLGGEAHGGVDEFGSEGAPMWWSRWVTSMPAARARSIWARISPSTASGWACSREWRDRRTTCSRLRRSVRRLGSRLRSVASERPPTRK